MKFPSRLDIDKKGCYSMNMRKISVSAFVISIVIAYALSSALSGIILYLWVMLADWLRNEQGFSMFRAALTMGMFGGIIGLFRAVPIIQRTMDEEFRNK